MLTKLIIVAEAECIYTFAYQRDKLVYVLTDQAQLNTEAIFWAKLNSMNTLNRSAFIDCGGGLSGYLNIPPRIKLQDGALLPVQMLTKATNQKQAKFRYGWQLVGKYVVYAGNSPQQINSRNLAHLPAAVCAGLLEEFPGQWIVRSALKSLSMLPQMAAEMKVLAVLAQQVEESVGSGQGFRGFPNYLKLLRSVSLDHNCQVVCNQERIFQDVLAWQELWQVDEVTLDPKLQFKAQIGEYQAGLNSGRVDLLIGANLEIHTTAGINIIDVNSDKLRLAPAKLNFVLLDDIHQQICIRNLQGIILIDLLKNMTKSEQDKIIEYLQKLFKQDITQTRVFGFSHTGLCELVRSRF